ncbi:MAG: SDR family oxidoreductase [Rhodospirillales bacterium]
MDLDLASKTALISGASGGIGLAIARAFLAEGARVAITGRTSDALDRAHDALAGTGRDGNLLTIACDVSDHEGAARAVEETTTTFGTVDCLIPNAGAAGYPVGWNVSTTAWQDAISANLFTGTNLVTAAVPQLMKAKGAVTFISSITGIEALPAPIPYSAAKAAIHAVAKGLADDLAKDGIRVNIVVPGNVLFPGGNWDRKLQDTERRVGIESYIASQVPMGRFGKPEEIADAVLFLSSARASFITGASLTVDGGQTRSFT